MSTKQVQSQWKSDPPIKQRSPASPAPERVVVGLENAADGVVVYHGHPGQEVNIALHKIVGPDFERARLRAVGLPDYLEQDGTFVVGALPENVLENIEFTLEIDVALR